MRIAEVLMKLRDQMQRAVLGKANEELVRTHEVESERRLSRHDEALDRIARRNAEAERARTREPANGTH